MQRAKNQLVLTSQLGLTPLGIPSLFRALPTRGNPLTFYHILIVDGYFTAVDIDGTKNNSLRCPGVVVGCQLFDFFYICNQLLSLQLCLLYALVSLVYILISFLTLHCFLY